MGFSLDTFENGSFYTLNDSLTVKTKDIQRFY